MFDTKVALVVRDDLESWQRLNVVAFLATGVVSAAPEVLGEPYVDAAGRRYERIAGQPMLIFAGTLADLQRTHRKGLEREVTVVPYVEAMFSTGNDDANRAVFQLEDADAMNLVGIALRGPKKAVDKVIKGLALHP
ncbi:hypothetical protein Y71_18465 [Kosakonia radicincitans DSM 16656]|uniref:DUF2000 family protein n=1 Tax=Kosakonia radicincitans TaxID=283686 RepID=UPI0002730130|nr:DUF2000 family protein [Kosakonia radicincitans]ARD61816.1 hypothetical protein Y71_18465 [Kosakonia radicincitans DSM 16656]MDD7996043.1 DUF2000 family protein [Kosakonia radicincitans]SKC23011.1 hypothetical protein SAMN05216168_4987 [Kosakonia radicincitans]